MLTAEKSVPYPYHQEAVVPKLHFAMQEGFNRDSVRLKLQDREVYSKSNLTTRTQIGLADSIDVETQSGSQVLEIEIATRGKSLAIPIKVEDSTYIAISITPDGQVSHRISGEPFGYL